MWDMPATAGIDTGISRGGMICEKESYDDYLLLPCSVPVFLHTAADAGACCGTDAAEQPAALDRLQLLDIVKADVLMIHDDAASFLL